MTVPQPLWSNARSRGQNVGSPYVSHSYNLGRSATRFPYLLIQALPERGFMGDFWFLSISVGKIAFLGIPKVRSDVVRLRSSLDIQNLLHGHLKFVFSESSRSGASVGKDAVSRNHTDRWMVTVGTRSGEWDCNAYVPTLCRYFCARLSRPFPPQMPLHCSVVAHVWHMSGRK